jgi:hypothetical protein
MPARAALVPNNGVGIGHLPQRAALMALLAAARFARTTAKAAGDPRLLTNPSLEGGLELFELSRPKRRRRSETSARSAKISALSEAINSSTSAGSVIPPLIQIRAAMSPTTRRANKIHQTCGLSDSLRLGSYLWRRRKATHPDDDITLIVLTLPSKPDDRKVNSSARR